MYTKLLIGTYVRLYTTIVWISSKKRESQAACRYLPKGCAALALDGTRKQASYRRGFWKRSQPSGYKLLRVRFEGVKPVRFDDCVTGFLVNNNKAHLGRLVGVAVHTDGSLLVPDDMNSVIYRMGHL